MAEVGTELLKQYGILGFTIFMIYLVLKHFMRSSAEKDQQVFRITQAASEAMEKITDRFSNALGSNTEAINANSKAIGELCKSELAMTNASQKVAEACDRTAAQSREEHARILEHIQMTARTRQ